MDGLSDRGSIPLRSIGEVLHRALNRERTGDLLSSVLFIIAGEGAGYRQKKSNKL